MALTLDHNVKHKPTVFLVYKVEDKAIVFQQWLFIYCFSNEDKNVYYSLPHTSAKPVQLL
jgi:hypothetical protein